MIPVKLSIQGLYSYQETQEIDFTRLTESQVFGIFGPVGSGKSAILEAITFALYGRTERMNVSGDDRNYNMLNLRSDKLSIEFEFLSGQNDGTRYRATANTRRKSTNFLDVYTIARDAYEWKNGDWEPIEVDSIANIIGLSYENFKRTIIIPQGQFQEFLQLGPTDRTKMMREIFNLSKFNLEPRVKSLIGKNLNEISGLEGQLLEIPEVTEADLKTRKQEIGEKEKDWQTQNKLREELRKEFEAIQQVLEKAAELAAKQEHLQKLESAIPQMEERKAALQQFEACRAEFRDVLAEHLRNQQEQSRIQEALKTLQKQYSTQSDQLKNQRETFEKTRKSWENRDAEKQKAEELSRLAEALSHQQKAAELSGRIEKGRGKIEEMGGKKEALDAQVKSSEAALKGQKAALPDGSVISGLGIWKEKKTQLAANLATAQKRAGSLEKELEDARKEIRALEQKLPLPDQFGDLTGKARFEKALELIAENIGETQALIRKKSTAVGLAAFATELREGEPCPLCGAEHHPHPHSGAESQEDLEKAEKELDRLNEEERQVERQANDFNFQQKQIDRLAKDLSAEQKAVAEAKTALENHIETFDFKGFTLPDIDRFDAIQKEFQVANAAIRKAETDLETLRQSAEKSRSDHEKAVKLMDDLVAQERNEISSREALVKTLKSLQWEDFENSNPTDLKTESQAIFTSLERLEKDFKAGEQQITALEKAVQETEKALAVEQSALKTAEKRAAEIAETIEIRLKSGGFESLEAVKAILAKELDTEAEKKAIQQHEEDLKFTRREIARLKKEMEGKEVSPEAGKAVKEKLAAAEKAANDLKGEIGGLENALKEAQNALKKRKTLSEKLDQLRIRQANLDELKRLFFKQGFVNYVSTIFLTELVSRANERFHKLTRNMLSLEVDEDNKFQVVDMLNGGQRRSVKTLSGGQTFQAALCLALALADSIQQQQGSRHNFFFMDEGFGTLDKNSLQIVFDTLKSLRQENRIVGVISHVEELQQEIDHYLRVRQDEEKGSLVTGSWE